jgi:translation initiation factor IF-1
MPKQDTLILKGTVIELLPNATFKIQLENQMIVLGHLSGKMRTHNISVKLGDSVDVEMSMYDNTKGRITFRHKLSATK